MNKKLGSLTKKMLSHTKCVLECLFFASLGSAVAVVVVHNLQFIHSFNFLLRNENTKKIKDLLQMPLKISH